LHRQCDTSNTVSLIICCVHGARTW
jgi:hypothetical protein